MPFKKTHFLSAAKNFSPQRKPNASQVLPFDILHIILLLLQNNTTALQRCSLVSRMWREAAMPLLFCVTKLPVSQARHDRVQQFHAFLQAGSHYIRDFVEELQLIGTSRGEEKLALNGATVTAIARLLPSLSAIRLESFELYWPDVGWTPLCPSVHSLTLVDIGGWSTEPYGYLLTILPQLTTMSVHHIDGRHSQACLSMAAIHTKKLDTLSLVATPLLINQPCKLSVTSLRVSPLHHHIPAIGEYIRAASTDLIHFWLDVDLLELSLCRPSDEFWSRLNLSLCSSLQSLTIHMTIHPKSRYWNQFSRYRWEAICGVLFQAPPQIRTICVEFCVSQDTDKQKSVLQDFHRDADWAKLRALLVPLCDLQRVEFRCLSSVARDLATKVTQKIEIELSDWVATGVLRCSLY